MTEFLEALKAFLAGQADFARVDAALSQALAADPASGPAIFKTIDEIYRAGRLPLQLYVLMKNRIAASHARPMPPPAAPPAAGQPAASQPAAPPPPDDDPADRTILRTARPPGAQQTVQTGGAARASGATGPATGQHTGQHTGQFAGQQTGQHTGQQTGQHTGQHTGAPRTGTSGPWSTGTGTGMGTGSSGWSGASGWADMEAPTLQPGSVLKGRFVLENIVGRGGMGVVFRARDLRAEEAQDRNPYVAIKILNDEFRKHPESLKALQRESKKAQNLAHPNIATVFDFDRDGAVVYMQMEFLEGDSLDRLIKRKNFEGLPFAEAYPLIEGLGRALSYAHGKGIVHSDFKPGNCYLTKSGVIKVFDFGIARAAKISDKSASEHTRFDPGTLGALTMSYASCEMIEGDDPDPRDDIYALGCVAYELLTGNHPFNKKPAAVARDEKMTPPIVKGLRKQQVRALQRAVAFARKDRSPSVDEFLDELGGGGRIPIVGGVRGLAVAAGVVLVIVVGVAMVPGMLEDRTARRIGEALTASVAGGDPAEIEAAVSNFLAIDNEVLRRRVLADGGLEDSLPENYADLARSLADSTRRAYRFPDAVRVLDSAAAVFPTDFRLRDAREEIDADKAQLLASLDESFNQAIEQTRLLADPDNPDVTDVLAILEEADPANPLLSSPLLALSYAGAAEAALTGGRLAEARDLLGAGLARYGNDSGLLSLDERLQAALMSEQNQLRIAELREIIEAGSLADATLDDLRGLTGPAAELQSLLDEAQTDRTLDAYRNRLSVTATARVRELAAARDWAGATAIVDEFAALLPEGTASAGREAIAAARTEYQSAVETRLNAIREASTAGNLAAATAAYRELEAFGVDEATLQQGQTSLDQAYVRVAREQRARQEFAEARETVASGLGILPGSAALQRESDDIAAAEARQQVADADAAAEQLVRDVAIVVGRIESALAAPELDIAAARQAIADVDELGGLDPGNALVRSAPADVANKLAARARALGASGQWDNALDLLDESVVLTGGATALSTARAEIEIGRDQAGRAESAERITGERARLAALLGNPTYEAAWETEFRGLLTSLGSLLPAGDPALAEARSQAARLYVTRAREMRSGATPRLPEADRLLNVAQGFSPDAQELAVERAALAEARRSADESAAEQLELAEIDRWKRSFETQAQANLPGPVQTALEELRELLPANDPYLTDNVPREIGGMYERMSKIATADNRRDYEQGVRLAEQGLALVPTHEGLRAQLNAARTSRRNANIAAVQTLVDNGPYTDLEAARTLRATIDSDSSALDSDWDQAGLLARIEARAAAGADASIYEWSAALGFTVAPPATRGVPCTAGLAGRGSSSSGLCYDELEADVQGPRLVVVRMSGGAPGFIAVSRDEARVSEWNDYCRLSGGCSPIAGRDAGEPATNVSRDQVLDYVRWLTDKTGYTYRLPTSAEWVLFASAEQTRADNNCFGVRPLRPTGDGQPNELGLRDVFGNAREWVTASGNEVEVRGGSHRDRSCTAQTALDHDGAAELMTGFRVVREQVEQD